MNVVNDSDLIPVTCSKVKAVVFGAKLWSACSLLPLSLPQARLQEKQRSRDQATLARFP
jgi:hypothetical protein